MVQDTRIVGIILAVVLGIILQVIFVFADSIDKPYKAVLEFSKAYFWIDESMSERLCDERKIIILLLYHYSIRIVIAALVDIYNFKTVFFEYTFMRYSKYIINLFYYNLFITHASNKIKKNTNQNKPNTAQNNTKNLNTNTEKSSKNSNNK